jgi:hypothetical protein
MSNDRFSRIRAFAGPNSLEPSRNPSEQNTNIVRGVLEGLRIVTGYIPSSGTVTDPSRGFTSIYTGAGIYVVTLVPPFSNAGSYTVNVTLYNTIQLVSSVIVTNNQIFVYFKDFGGLAVPSNFYFTAIGN